MSDAKTFTGSNKGFTLDLPDWAVDELNKLPVYLPANEERMAAVIEFSRMNFQHQTGGPFAAGIFERDTGKLIVLGVNRVVPFNCSSAHAEVMAISLAQKHLVVYDLGAAGLTAHQIVVNWRPCAGSNGCKWVKHFEGFGDRSSNWQSINCAASYHDS